EVFPGAADLVSRNAGNWNKLTRNILGAHRLLHKNTGHRKRHAQARIPWPLFFLILSLFAPGQIYLDVGSLRLTAYRLALFFLVPFVLTRLLGGSIRLKGYDIAI